MSDPDGRVDDLWVAAVATPQSTPDQVEVFFADCGERCGNAGSDPEAGAPCDGSAASAYNGRDSGSAACTGGGDWIGGIGNVAPKFTFVEFGPSAAVSIGTHSTRWEYGSSPPGSAITFDPRTRVGGGGGGNTDHSPPGRSGGVDRGPTLASQGGATIGTGESFCGFGRGDPRREYRRVTLVSTR